METENLPIGIRKSKVIALIREWIAAVGKNDTIPFTAHYRIVDIPLGEFEAGNVSYDDTIIILRQLTAEGLIVKYEKTYDFVDALASISGFRITINPEAFPLITSRNREGSGLRFPEGATWQEITIQFLNPHEVSIIYKATRQPANFETMGFLNEKTKLPNYEWKLLLQLATHKGEIDLKELRLSPKKRGNLRQHKKLLSDALRKAFDIRVDSDPFYDVKVENLYKIKLTLVPPPRDEVVEPERLERDDLGKDITRELEDMGYSKYESENQTGIE